MQFALQALPFSRHAQNDASFALRPTATGVFASVTPLRNAGARHPIPARLPLCPPPARSAVRILRNDGNSQGGRLLISGRMADVCAELNRLAVNDYACG